MNVEKFLEKRGQFNMKLGLDRITVLLEKLGNPQNDYKIVHVAGTNGKGSVCAMVAEALLLQEYKVGLYTSPHLVELRERIQVNGQLIPKKTLEEVFEKVKNHLTDHTYFEIVTAMALLAFKKAGCDIAVVEVGMGGRLDATNVVTPIVSVITNISLEHQRHLGASTKDIAGEKAGIIKKGVPVVTGADGSALEVIKQKALENKCELFRLDHTEIRSSMHGSFQKENAETAYKALQVIGRQVKLDDNNIKQGVYLAKWPGRLDYIEEDMIFDCAHNIAGIRRLAAEIKDLKATIVLGIMKDKDVAEICEELAHVAGHVIATRPQLDRAADPRVIAKHFSDVSIIPDMQMAIIQAQRPVVVTGSIFAVGEAYRALGLKPFDS